MAIYCSGGHIYAINDVSCEWEVIFNLLAVYNVFDGQYPAAYGFPSFINLYTLEREPSDEPSEELSTAKKRTKKRKVTSTVKLPLCAKTNKSVSFTEFVNSYEEFISSS